MLVMLIFGIVQIILFALDVNFLVPKRTDLEASHGPSAVTYFYVVTGIEIGINLVGFIDALLLRWQINEKKTGGSTHSHPSLAPASCSPRALLTSFRPGNYYE